MNPKTYHVEVKISVYVPSDKGFYSMKFFEEMAHGTEGLKTSLAKGFNDVLQYINREADRDAKT